MVVILRANPASTFMLHFLHAISYNNLRHISLHTGAVFAVLAVLAILALSRFSRFRSYRVLAVFAFPRSAARFRVFPFSGFHAEMLRITVAKIHTHTHTNTHTHFLHSSSVGTMFL